MQALKDPMTGKWNYQISIMREILTASAASWTLTWFFVRGFISVNLLSLASTWQTYDFSLIAGFFYKSPFASKFSWKKRSSHQGKKEVACTVSKPVFFCLWECGVSKIKHPRDSGGARPKGHPGLLLIFQDFLLLSNHTWREYVRAVGGVQGARLGPPLQSRVLCTCDFRDLKYKAKLHIRPKRGFVHIYGDVHEFGVILFPALLKFKTKLACMWI